MSTFKVRAADEVRRLRVEQRLHPDKQLALEGLVDAYESKVRRAVEGLVSTDAVALAPPPSVMYEFGYDAWWAEVSRRLPPGYALRPHHTVGFRWLVLDEAARAAVKPVDYMTGFVLVWAVLMTAAVVAMAVGEVL